MAVRNEGTREWWNNEQQTKNTDENNNDDDEKDTTSSLIKNLVVDTLIFGSSPLSIATFSSLTGQQAPFLSGKIFPENPNFQG